MTPICRAKSAFFFIVGHSSGKRLLKDAFPFLGILPSQCIPEMIDYGIPIDSLDALVPPCMSIRSYVHAATSIWPSWSLPMSLA